MRFLFLTTSLAALAAVTALQAQQSSSSRDDRTASTAFVFTDSFETLAGVSINYSQAAWRDGYDAMLEGLKGSNYSRLGKDWWTTFDTVGALEIGGTKVEAGSYYLGLAVGEDGAFSLLLFDSRQVMKAGLLPATTALYRGDARAQLVAPMTLAKYSLKEVAAKLEIEITADKKDPTTGRLAIRWGKHELSAPVRFHLATAKEPAAPKK